MPDNQISEFTEKYNKIYRVQMPKVTPHVCRHTYCSEKAKKGMNPNTLKEREVKMSEKIERRKQRRKSVGE